MSAMSHPLYGIYYDVDGNTKKKIIIKFLWWWNVYDWQEHSIKLYIYIYIMVNIRLYVLHTSSTYFIPFTVCIIK